MKTSEVLKHAKLGVWDGTPEHYKCNPCGLKTYICNATNDLFHHRKDLWTANGESEEDAAHDVCCATRRIMGKLFIGGYYEQTFVSWKSAGGVVYDSIFARQQARLQWLDEIIAECEAEGN